MIHNSFVWLTGTSTSSSVTKYLLLLLFIFLGLNWINKLFKKILPNNSVKYQAQKGTEIVGYILVVILTISYFNGSFCPDANETINQVWKNLVEIRSQLFTISQIYVT